MVVVHQPVLFGNYCNSLWRTYEADIFRTRLFASEMLNLHISQLHRLDRPLMAHIDKHAHTHTHNGSEPRQTFDVCMYYSIVLGESQLLGTRTPHRNVVL